MDWNSILFERDRAYRKMSEAKKNLQKKCKHDGDKYVECTDFHRRDYGTFCSICEKLLHDNN